MLELNIQNKLILTSCEAGELKSLNRYNSRFRILFIMEGNGMAILDDNSHNYQKDSFFLLAPKQGFSFITVSQTKIFVIILGQYHAPVNKYERPISGFASLFRHVESICLTKKFMQGKRMELDTDRKSASQLIQQLIYEMIHRHVSGKEIVKNSVFLLVYILARNVDNKNDFEQANEYHPEADRILDYVKQQITENNKLTIQEVAEKFDLTEETINKNIIAKSGFTLKNFIIKYRTDLFKSRLLKIDVEELSHS